MELKATVLIDNTAPDTLLVEWGLSIYIEYRGYRVLLDAEKGLVVFDSCCHGGVDIVIEEAREVLGKDVYAPVGGLHLFRSGDELCRRWRKGLEKQVYRA